jgi:hypothetical protein
MSDFPDCGVLISAFSRYGGDDIEVSVRALSKFFPLEGHTLGRHF